MRGVDLFRSFCRLSIRTSTTPLLPSPLSLTGSPFHSADASSQPDWHRNATSFEVVYAAATDLTPASRMIVSLRLCGMPHRASPSLPYYKLVHYRKPDRSSVVFLRQSADEPPACAGLGPRLKDRISPVAGGFAYVVAEPLYCASASKQAWAVCSTATSDAAVVAAVVLAVLHVGPAVSFEGETR